MSAGNDQHRIVAGLCSQRHAEWLMGAGEVYVALDVPRTLLRIGVGGASPGAWYLAVGERGVEVPLDTDNVRIHLTYKRDRLRGGRYSLREQIAACDELLSRLGGELYSSTQERLAAAIEAVSRRHPALRARSAALGCPKALLHSALFDGGDAGREAWRRFKDAITDGFGADARREAADLADRIVADVQGAMWES